MKHYILSTLLLVGLAGCNKNSPSPTPAPTPTGGTWTWTSCKMIDTPTYPTRSVGTASRVVVPNAVTLVFSPDGKAVLTVDNYISRDWLSSTGAGTYTFRNGIVTVTYPNGGGSGVDYVETSTTLTDHTLTLVHTDLSGADKVEYVTTYTR